MEKPEGRPKKLGDVAELPNYQKELDANGIEPTAAYRWAHDVVRISKKVRYA